MRTLARRIAEEKPVIGVIHLPPLPGSPGYRSMGEVVGRAMRDAASYWRAGIRWVIVENYGDAPYKVRVGPAETAAMALVVERIRREYKDLVVGVNLLRNSGPEAFIAAHVSGASFIRVNALSEVVSAPEGLLMPVANEIAQARRILGDEDVAILADIHVKHGVPLGARSIEDSARDACSRAGADAVIVTGRATGEAPSLEDVLEAGKAGCPVLVGSGVDEENASMFLEAADGLIVGTFFKKDGATANPVDEERVRRLLRALP